MLERICFWLCVAGFGAAVVLITGCTTVHKKEPAKLVTIKDGGVQARIIQARRVHIDQQGRVFLY